MQNNSKIETFVICGFLGAGKTTLLKNLALIGDMKERTVILVNDFGFIDIDQQILKSGDLEVLPLNNGCVCCSLRGELITTILNIYDQLAPKRLFIEPSGVASPDRIKETLKDDKLRSIVYLKQVINVVDALNFVKYKDTLGDFFVNQLTCSDTIIINKTDLITSDQLLSIQTEISSLNKEALIFPTQYGVIPLSVLDHEYLMKEMDETHPHVHTEKVHMDTFEIDITGHIFEQEKLNDFFAVLKYDQFGHVLRMKGIFRVAEGQLLVNMVPDQINVEPINHTNERVIFFGIGLMKPLIQQQLFECEISNESG